MSYYVLKVLGIATAGTPEAVQLRVRDRYIKDFAPEYAGGRGHVTLSRYPTGAKRFPTAGAAWIYWRKAYGTREDGKPNMPLTSYTCIIEEVP